MRVKDVSGLHNDRTPKAQQHQYYISLFFFSLVRSDCFKNIKFKSLLFSMEFGRNCCIAINTLLGYISIYLEKTASIGLVALDKPHKWYKYKVDGDISYFNLMVSQIIISYVS